MWHKANTRSIIQITEFSLLLVKARKSIIHLISIYSSSCFISEILTQKTKKVTEAKGRVAKISFLSVKSQTVHMHGGLQAYFSPFLWWSYILRLLSYIVVSQPKNRHLVFLEAIVIFQMPTLLSHIVTRHFPITIGKIFLWCNRLLVMSQL